SRQLSRVASQHANDHAARRRQIVWPATPMQAGGMRSWLMSSCKAKKYLAPALVLAALALFFFALILFITPANAQKIKQLPPPPPAPRFKPKPTPTPEYEVLRISSNLVVVPVSVTDANGQPMLGLKQTDFHVTEEGRAQEIAQMGDPEQVPLDIAILDRKSTRL